MAEKKSSADRLSKYVNLQDLPEGSRWQTPVSKLKDAMEQTDIASGKKPNKIAQDYVTDIADGSVSDYGQSVVDKKKQEIGELADQYKREARGVKDTSIRGKIREATGMKKGGKVSSASSRADGCAIRGKTRA